MTGSVLLPSESLNSSTTAHGSHPKMAVLGWCSSFLSVATIQHSGPKQGEERAHFSLQVTAGH